MIQKVEIKLSKKKTYLAFLFSVVFFIGGIFLVYKSSDLSYYTIDYKKNGIVALLIGFLAIVLSVYMFYYSIK